jgi:cell division protein FtsQ
MRQRGKRHLDRAAAPRRLARWSTQAGAAVAGLLLGAFLFEPIAARLAPRKCLLETASVIGVHRVTAEELVDASGVTAGTPTLALDPAVVSERLASHPWISAARVTTFLPRKLLVAVVEREAAAIVEIGTPATAWLVDASGTPFASATGIDREMHPTIVGVEDAQPQRPHPLLAQGVQIARAVGKRELPAARRVRLGGGDPQGLPELRLGPRERKVVLGGGDLELKLDRLAWVLKADLAEMGPASTIDLRFGSRVIFRDGPPPSGDEATGTRGGVGPSKGGRAG